MPEREELGEKFQAAIDAFKDERIKWFIGKSRALIDAGLISLEKMDELMRFLMRDEIERHRILRELEKNGPLTVDELAEKTGIDTDRVEEHVKVMCIVGEVVRSGEGAYAVAGPVDEMMEERRRCPCETVVALLHRLIGLWG